MKQIINIPYQECPSFLGCSSPKCPLDPLVESRVRYPDEEKCRANKPTRYRIGSKYPNLLPYQGLTISEWKGKQRWAALPPAEREKITTQGLKALNALKTGLQRVNSQ